MSRTHTASLSALPLLLTALWALAVPVPAHADADADADADAKVPDPAAANDTEQAEEAQTDPESPPADTRARPLWVEAEVGYASMDMGGFRHAYGGWGTQLIEHKGEGVGLLAALGGRYKVLVVGARVGHSVFEAYNITTVGGEVGIQMPWRWVEPRFQLHAGYGWHGDVGHPELQDSSVAGLVWGGGVGFRIHVHPVWTFGASFDTDVLSATANAVLASSGPGVDPQVQEFYRAAIARGDLAAAHPGSGWLMRTGITVGARFW